MSPPRLIRDLDGLRQRDSRTDRGRAPADSGRAPPGARGPTDELSGEDHAPRHGLAIPDGIDQQTGHLVAHLLDGLADTGEGRSDGRRYRRVVEADHGD